MSREVDTRELEQTHVRPERSTEAHRLLTQVSDRLPGDHRVDITAFDSLTGNPATVRSTAAGAEPGDTVSQAVRHVTAISPLLSVGGSPREFAPDPAVQATSSGATAVHLQQHHHGSPVFGAALTVRFHPDGTLRETVGTVYSIPEGTVATPVLSAAEAVARAAGHAAVPDPDEMETRDGYGQLPRPAQVDVSGYRAGTDRRDNHLGGPSDRI